MSLLRYEWRKLAGTPALWAFLTLCLVFNGFLLYASMWTCREFNEGSAIAARLGQRVDENFAEGCARLPWPETSDKREERENLLAVLRGLEDPLVRYDGQLLRQFYADILRSSSWEAVLMDIKLQQVERRAGQLARTGAAMDFFAGPVTVEANSFLYKIFFKALLMEGVLLGALSMLCLLDHERANRTTAALCVSRTGRRLWRTKAAAGVTAALALYLLLAVASFMLYFALWDYSGVWGASMASQFNTGIWSRSDVQYETSRPFIPWADFTAGTYLLSAVGLGAALTVVFTLLAAVCGILAGNAYVSTVAMVLLVMTGWAAWYAGYMGGNWAVFVTHSFFPTSQLDQTLGWFTEGGIIYFIPWQETVTTALWLLLGGGGTAMALSRFRRKDVLT